MKRLQVNDVIFKKHYDGMRSGFEFKDLPKDLLPTDIIRWETCDAYYGSDSSHDAYSLLKVLRSRPQTDEEFKEYKEFLETRKKLEKFKRYAEFLKLQKEFEGVELDMDEGYELEKKEYELKRKRRNRFEEGDYE